MSRQHGWAMKKSAYFALLITCFSSCSTGLRKPAGSDDPILEKLGVPGRLDGVTHGPVRNQLSGEICWGYTLADMAEDQYIKANGSYQHMAHPSPEYLLFWHIYAQIKNNLSTFAEDANAITAYRNGTQDKKLITRALHALDAYPVDSNQDPKVKDKNPLLTPDVGSVASSSLKEIAQFGMMPDDYFKNSVGKDLAFTTADQEKKFEEMLPHFIGQVVLKNHANYLGPKNQINMNLYSDLVKEFSDILGLTERKITMPIPTMSFQWDGGNYTPISFMRSYLHYDPSDYVALTPAKDLAGQQLALDAIAYTINTNVPVPVGIEIFQDKDPSDTQDGDDNDAWSRAQKTGIFTVDYCPMDQASQSRKCNDDGGGARSLRCKLFAFKRKRSAVSINHSK
jgi:hypothetical protein